MEIIALISYYIPYHIISYIISYHIILYCIIFYHILYYIILYYVILYLIVDLPPGFGIWDFNRSTVYIIVDHCYLILQYIPSSPSTSWGQKHPWSATFFSVAFQLLKIWQITVDPRGISDDGIPALVGPTSPPFRLVEIAQNRAGFFQLMHGWKRIKSYHH